MKNHSKKYELFMQSNKALHLILISKKISKLLKNLPETSSPSRLTGHARSKKWVFWNFRFYFEYKNV